MTDWGDNTISPLDDDEFREWAARQGIDIDDDELDLTALYNEFLSWQLRVTTILHHPEQ